MEKLIALYKEWSGNVPATTEKLPGAGSNREYYRFRAADGSSVIGCIGTSRDENHAFVYLARHFTRRKLPVPRVLAVSSDELRYLQTDLGNVSLFDAIRGGREAGGRYTLAEQQLLKQTIRELPNIQIRGARELDFSNCYPQPAFDQDSVLFDLNYFKYCFLKATELDFHELKLEADFRLMAKDLTQAGDEQCFLYRDFQARNVMLSPLQPPPVGEASSKGRGVFFIDFQGGRRGSSHHFVARLRLFVLFRLLQVLGAYGFRGYFERKQHFIDSIPPAIQNLRELLASAQLPYPHLVDILQRLCALPQFQLVEATASRADGYKTTEHNPYKAHPLDGPATFSKYDAQGPLVVKVYSFSYRKGIPDDESGNGGGYVFDCRSTHNPGRYEPYKKLTGLDEPVIRFLEDDGEILTFLDSVYRLADAHVRRYIQRGFTSLMFCFGCTGGQHRSVYSAQHLAEHIHRKFGIEVRIVHREQGITQTLR